MKVGVKTAAWQGEERDFALLGLDTWPAAEYSVSRVADLDESGVYVYSSGQDWELTVTGLASERLDFRRRRIHNAIVVRGRADDRVAVDLAGRLGVELLSSQRRLELSSRLDAFLTEDAVAAWFDGEGPSQADLLSVLQPFASGNAPDASSPSRAPLRMRVGALARNARDLWTSALNSLLSGVAGLAVVGLIYDDPSIKDISGVLLLVDDRDSSGPVELVTLATNDPQDGGNDGRGKARVLLIILAALTLIGLIWLILRRRQ